MGEKLIYDEAVGPFSSLRYTHLVTTYLQHCSCVLDVGCGFGDLVMYLPPGLQYLGIDRNHDRVDVARTRFPFLSWIADDFLTHEFGGKTFELVVGCSLFSGDYWTEEMIVKTVEKMYALASREVVIVANGPWMPVVQKACEPYRRTQMEWSFPHMDLCLKK